MRYSIIHHPAFCCLEKIFCTQAVAEAGLWLSVHLHPFLIRISVDFKGKEAFCLNFYKASFSLAFKFTGERGTAPSYQPRAYPHALSRYQVLPTCLKKKEKKPTVGNKILVNAAHFPAHSAGMSLFRTQDTAFQKCSFTCHYVCARKQALQHKMPLKKPESHSAEQLFAFSPGSIIRAAPLQAEHRNHKWHWSTTISHFLLLRTETGTQRPQRPRSPHRKMRMLLVWIMNALVVQKHRLSVNSVN